MFRETFRVISTKKKLFAQITLALALPLSLLFLVQATITQLNLTNSGDQGTVFHKKYGWAIKLSLSELYFNLILLLSFLATSAVGYTVACLYTSKDVTFKKVTAAVPKVCRKRFTVTYRWIFLIYVAVSLIFIGLLMCAALLLTVTLPVGIILVIIVIIAFIVGIFYITIIMQLSCVVSVLEDVCGRKAMSRSRVLVKGKLWSIVGCYVLFGLCFGLVQPAFQFVVVQGVMVQSMALRVVFGIVLWLLLSLQVLVSLVMTTVIYFVCRSHHGENMDMAILADGLNVHYETEKYVELEQSRA